MKSRLWHGEIAVDSAFHAPGGAIEALTAHGNLEGMADSSLQNSLLKKAVGGRCFRQMIIPSSLKDAASSCKGLVVIERCFRFLKRTRIKMTPMNHWLPRKIEAHVKICVLALLIERLAEISSGRSWPRIKQRLRALPISYFSTAEHGFYRTNELTNDVKNILKSLRISYPKLVRGVEKHSKNV